MSAHRKSAQLVALIDSLQRGLVEPSSLSWRLRRKVIQYYMEEHSEVSCRRVAEIVGCSHTHVIRVRQAMAELAAYDLETLDVKKVAAQFRLKKEELQRRAMLDHDWGTAWRIEMDYVEKLQGFGYILLAPHRVVNINVDLEGKLREFFQEFGVPTAGDFLARLREARVVPELEAGGDGGGPAAAPETVDATGGNGKKRDLPPLNQGETG